MLLQGCVLAASALLGPAAFLPLTASANVCKALCGVAAGATRVTAAVLDSAHVDDTATSGTHSAYSCWNALDAIEGCPCKQD